MRKTLACVLGAALAGPAGAAELASGAARLGNLPALPLSVVEEAAAPMPSFSAVRSAASIAAVPAAPAAPALAPLRASVEAIRDGRAAGGDPAGSARPLDMLFSNAKPADGAAAPSVSAPSRRWRAVAALAPFAALAPHAMAVVPAWRGELVHDAVNLGLAMALGGLIGAEREMHDKSAGLRTNILIAMGAALFAMISAHFSHDFHVAAQIVTGIGFLGGGAIMRDGDHVKGLTTAATIWLVAAIGLALGNDFYVLAGLGTALALVVQTLFTGLDRKIGEGHDNRTYKIASDQQESFAAIRTVFEKNGVKIIRERLMKKNGRLYSEWWTVGPRVGQEAASKSLLEMPGLSDVGY